MTSSTSTAGTGSWELQGLSCPPRVYHMAGVELSFLSGWMENIQQKMKGEWSAGFVRYFMTVVVWRLKSVWETVVDFTCTSFHLHLSTMAVTVATVEKVNPRTQLSWSYNKLNKFLCVDVDNEHYFFDSRATGNERKYYFNKNKCTSVSFWEKHG